jgi:hypothetical protein
MKLKQISVPIQNSHHRLVEITRALGNEGIALRALNLVDTDNLGIFRFLVSDYTAATRILMQHRIEASVEDVVAVEIENRPGELSRILEYFQEDDIRIQYTYALAGAGNNGTVMVFRFSDNDSALKILMDKGARVIDMSTFDIIDGNMAA